MRISNKKGYFYESSGNRFVVEEESIDTKRSDSCKKMICVHQNIIQKKTNLRQKVISKTICFQNTSAIK